MRFHWGLLSILGFLFLLGCGDKARVSFEAGPVMTGLIQKHRDDLAKQAAFQEFSKKIQCPPESKYESNPDINYFAEYASLSTTPPIDVTLIRVGTENNLGTFRLSSLRRALEQNHLSLPGTTIPTKTWIRLGTKERLERSPILIRAKCFVLDEPENLETNGLDLVIIADVVKLSGRISTHPEARENQPALPSGNVIIFGIETDFGDRSLVETNGGAGGDLTLPITKSLTAKDPQWKITPQELESIRSEVRKHFTTEARYVRSREPESRDGSQLLLSWASVRMHFPFVDTSKIEERIYSKEFLLTESVPPQVIEFRNKCARHQIEASDYDRILADPASVPFLIRGWTVAAERYQKRLNGKQDLFFLDDNRLSIQISETISEDVKVVERSRPYDPVYEMPILHYPAYQGTPAGVVRVFRAFGSGSLRSLSEPGQEGKFFSQPKYDLPKQELYFARQRRVEDRVSFAASHQGGDFDTTLSREAAYSWYDRTDNLEFIPFRVVQGDTSETPLPKPAVPATQPTILPREVHLPKPTNYEPLTTDGARLRKAMSFYGIQEDGPEWTEVESLFH